MPAWSDNIPLLSATSRFFLYGTFDPLDLLCTGLGALAAYWSLVRMSASEVQHDQVKLDDKPNV